MKFILSEHAKEKQLTFGDVVVNQFFVNQHGWLCQKVGSESYIQLTKEDGTPFANYFYRRFGSEPILRILPRVERVEF